MKEHSLGRNAGSKRHGATALARPRLLKDSLQHEHDGGRGHVAEARQDFARWGHCLFRKAETFLDSIENGSSARMYCPQVDRERIATARHPGPEALECAGQSGRNL